ncbi:MAG: hypothetical protein IK051_09990 [Rhodocyclaceae bacterium]|nr:hypothetical protein [Rhodocyclaceae bacterium]
MEAEQAQNKGGLDALAARLDARYRQERKAREVVEKIKQTPPLDANATWREVTMWKALEASACETGAERITKEDLDSFFWIDACTDEREQAKMRARRSMPFGGKGIPPVLLFLIGVVLFSMKTGTPLMSVIAGAPILIIGFALAGCVAGLLFGGVGVVALMIFALLSLFA